MSSFSLVYSAHLKVSSYLFRRDYTFAALGKRKVILFGGGIPVIHESVVARGEQLDYRPKNLQTLRHTIWGRSDVMYERFSDHFADG